MKNIITAQIEFDFKGEHYTPSSSVNLDEQMEAHGQVPNLRGLLAASNNINPYSYEFEVMEISPITISHSEGMVGQFISKDKQLDVEGFEKQWHENRVVDGLRLIAKKHLDMEDLTQDQAILAALQDAYRLGLSAKS